MTTLPVPSALSLSPPPAALRLGYAGLAPFVGGALLLGLGLPDAQAHAFVAQALSAYAAVIISFLGGIHWGLGFRDGDPMRFAWGVVPSLLAWAAVMMPAYAGLVIHGAVLVLCYAIDRRVYPAAGLQPWLTLRFRLSAVASLSCFLGAAAT